MWRQPGSNRDGLPSDTLLTIHTSHNAWSMTQLMLVSLASSRNSFDVLLIDDHSHIIDQNKLAEDWGVKTLHWGDGFNVQMGVTH